MRRALLVCIFCWLVLTAPALPEAYELPVSAPLPYSTIEVDLRGGRIEVAISTDDEQLLDAKDYLEGDDTEGFISLERSSTGSLQIGQVYGQDHLAPRVVLHLTIKPETVLIVKGSDLAVMIEDQRPLPDPQPDGSGQTVVSPCPAGCPPATLQLQPLDSDVRLIAVRGVKLAGTRTRYRIERSFGTVSGEVTRGDVTIAEHRGNLALKGHDADLIVDNFTGPIELQWEGGSFATHVGTGILRGLVSGLSSVELEGWVGNVQLTVREAPLRLSHSGAPDGLIQIVGERTDVETDGLTGPATFDLKYGSLKAKDSQARLSVQARRTAPIELEQCKGPTDLKLEENSEAKIHGVEQRLGARVTDSKLDFETVREVDLRAHGATISCREVSAAARLAMTDSEIDLDLSGVQGYPELKLGGSTRGRVSLRSPCIVRLDGEADAVRHQLTVDGCDMLESGDSTHPAWRTAGGMRPPQIITLSLEDGAEVTVKSKP